MSNRDAYLDSVCREVRFRAARKYIRQELSAHIDDKAAVLEASGISDAEAAAIKAMGDPAETGRALSAIHRPRVAWGVIACVLLLTVAGVVPALAGPFTFFYKSSWIGISFGDSRTALITCLATLAAITAMAFSDYSRLFRLRSVFFTVGLGGIATSVILTAVIPEATLPIAYNGIIVDVNAAHILKSTALTVSSVLFPLGTAGFVHRARARHIRNMFLPAGLIAVSSCALYIISGVSALLMAAAGLIMLMAALASNPQRFASKLRCAVGCIATIVAPIMLTWMLFPKPVSGSDFDIVKFVLPGNRLNVSDPAYGRMLSPSDMDNAFTAAFKSYGWLYSIGIIALFATLLVLMITRSLKVSNSFGRLLALGICTYFCINLVFFLLSCYGIINLSVGLPFADTNIFSSLTDALLIGMFLSVWRRSSFMPRDAASAMPAAASVPASPAS
jgi:hypothetical protein